MRREPIRCQIYSPGALAKIDMTISGAASLSGKHP
jgi:hypothetical protein